MKETWLGLVCLSTRGHNGLPRSIIHRFVSFPLLRRPSFVIIPLWVACWERAFNRLFVMIVRRGSWVAAHNGLPVLSSLSCRTPGIFISIASLPQAFWRRGWYVRRRPCNKTYHWSRFRCDSLFSWILLYSFCHRFRTNCRTGNGWWFHSSRVKFPLVSMSASWLLVSMYLIWIFGSNLIRSSNQPSATLWVLETCLIVGLLPLIIILITASLSSNTYNKASWCENWTFEGTINIFQNVDHSLRSLVWSVIFVTVHNGLPRSIMGLNCVSKD